MECIPLVETDTRDLIDPVTRSLYSRGFMTELRGKIIIENRGYQEEASIISKKCSRHTTMNGTQQRKSVAIIADIFVCSFRSLRRVAVVLVATLLEDFVT